MQFCTHQKSWSWTRKQHAYARVKSCNLMPECAWHLIQQTCSGMKNLQRPGLQSFVCVSKPKTGKASNHKPQLQFSCWAAAYLHLAPRYLSNISRGDHLRNGHVCKNHGNGSKRFHFTLCVQLSKSMRKGSRDMILNDERRCNFIKANSFHCLPERMLLLQFIWPGNARCSCPNNKPDRGSAAWVKITLLRIQGHRYTPWR